MRTSYIRRLRRFRNVLTCGLLGLGVLNTYGSLLSDAKAKENRQRAADAIEQKKESTRINNERLNNLHTALVKPEAIIARYLKQRAGKKFTGEKVTENQYLVAKSERDEIKHQIDILKGK